MVLQPVGDASHRIAAAFAEGSLPDHRVQAGRIRGGKRTDQLAHHEHHSGSVISDQARHTMHGFQPPQVPKTARRSDRIEREDRPRRVSEAMIAALWFFSRITLALAAASGSQKVQRVRITVAVTAHSDCLCGTVIRCMAQSIHTSAMAVGDIPRLTRACRARIIRLIFRNSGNTTRSVSLSRCVQRAYVTERGWSMGTRCNALPVGGSVWGGQLVTGRAQISVDRDRAQQQI